MSIFLGHEHETRKQIYLPLDSFRTHYHFIGGTGKGKTTALDAMLHQLFRAREHAAHFILDRLGAFSFSLLMWLASPFCPKQVRDRVVYIDAAREDVVMPFNPLLYTTPAHGYFKVGRATDCILRAWANQNIEETPRLARWIFNAFWSAAQLNLTVADCAHLLMPGSEFHAPMMRLLPPLLQAEWAEITQARGEAARMLEAPRNRLKPFFENPLLRGIFGSHRSKLDVLQFMRDGKIVILNLAPQNRLSSQISDAMGGMILNEVLAAARSLPMGVRYPTYLWLDEFQNYIGPDMEAAIPEVRQLGVRLVLSHQSFSQLERGQTDLTSLIWQPQSRVILGVQGEDADLLAHEIASLKYDPERVKDEVFTRRQLLKAHQLIYLSSWSESEAAARNWQKMYGTNWSSQEGRSTGNAQAIGNTNSESFRLADPYNRLISKGGSQVRSTNKATSEMEGHGGSESSADGGSVTNSKSRSVAETLLPIHEEFLELSRRSYYTFEEQRALWAQQIRLLKTGQALVRLVNDPNVYRVDIERHAPGYLSWDIEKIIARRLDALEAVQQMIEENCASDLFVSPAAIERETAERLQRLLSPAIVIPSIVGSLADANVMQASVQENPLA